MFLRGDATRLPFADSSVDLVFGSPPYMDARTYGIGINMTCLEWIHWMLDVTHEAVRVSRGLVLWVVAGVTRKHCYWPGPEGLLYEAWRSGIQCWRPAFWFRHGIPGSGGKQWLKANIEYVLAFTKCTGRIPWADNKANGKPPKHDPGGPMSYRTPNGSRIGIPKRIKPTDRGRCPNAVIRKAISRQPGKSRADGSVEVQAYIPPTIANPGNLVRVKVGGGLLSHKLAHDNEAPFPQKLPEWFIRSWCPPAGLVLDPFSGSGTTVCAAEKLGRRGIGLDIRDSQCQLGMKRLASGVDRELFV